jgi:UDP-N-acetylglucosamine--dolichyl-phosphate N-acetylglucosaminephosphotransferase
MSIPSSILALVIFLVSFVVSFVAFRMAIPRLKQRGIVGRDVHKPGQPEVPEMGGLFSVIGFAVGIATVIAFNTFGSRFLSIDLSQILAVLSVVLLIAILGTIDDLIGMRQSVKALMPLIAALPLIAVRAGNTTMNIPFAGQVDFGIYYSAILVPLGVTGATNAVNMLAGFNGAEAGMGLVAMTSLAGVAYLEDETAAFLVLISAISALLATLYFNWYPARVFIGDAGTLSIGAIIASAVIIGNFERAGVIVIIPYLLDFVIKVKNRFPSKGWWGIYRAGKLYCPESGPVGLGQLILKITGGISERNLTLILIGFEAICGGIAIWLFW